ncbi:hypothetical protein HFN63_36950 [Rhizobium leguminosarum]|uniref:hypothetical protein n=1 Tax=Rhizobium leguminosarum TaxID=384 RepID=UPI001C93849A|nr:hypothetical protein [Rhizobium leguminosarum]MBY5775495.1 hypothetical protein [Rhizobium leguminosarum]
MTRLTPERSQMENGPKKRKAAAPDFNTPPQRAPRVKRLRSNSFGRGEGSTGQQKSGILETIESGHDTEVRGDVVSHSNGGRELTWSPSPDRQAPFVGQTGSNGLTSSGGERADKEDTHSDVVRLGATHVNTLHNYFGGSAPNPNSRTIKRKSAKGKTIGPGQQRTVHHYYDGSHDRLVLIADLEQLRQVAVPTTTGAKEVTFRTKAQFERYFGKPPTRVDMDNTCTITSFEPGIFRSKPRTWKTIEVEKQEDWRNENEMRDKKFKRMMESVGQSVKPFRDLTLTGLLSTAMGKFQTPGGERRRYHLYREPLIAGQYNPDALIRENGVYKAIYLKLFEGTRELSSFKDVVEKYGKDNVWLKNDFFDYMTHDQFDKHATTVDAAEKAFCEYTNRTYHPNVFVRVAAGWLSKIKYDKRDHREDPTKLDILLLDKHYRSLMQPKTMKWLNPELYNQRMSSANFARPATQGSSSRGAVEIEAVSDILAEKTNRPSAPVLMQSSKHHLVPVNRIPSLVAHYRIFPQNVSEKSGYTGNYTRNWGSIKREEAFNANDGHSSSTSQRPKRLMTDEQRRILRTPPPLPEQTDASDDEELFVRNSSASLPPEMSDNDRGSLASLSSGTSDDERSSLAMERERNSFALPPDSSDDEPAVRGRAPPERRSSAESEPPLSALRRTSVPAEDSADKRQGSSDRIKLSMAPEYPGFSDSSDDEPPVTIPRTTASSSIGDLAERNTSRATSAERSTRRASGSLYLKHDRSKGAGRD